MSAPHRIKYATDFSPASMAAYPHALENAKASGAELITVHVLFAPIPFAGEGVYVDPQTWDRIFAGALAETHKQLDPLVARAREAGVNATGVVLETEGAGRAGEIVRMAKDKGVDLLVLGTHGRSGVARFFLGSVAARVVATATCPVLTVRAPEDVSEDATERAARAAA